MYLKKPRTAFCMLQFLAALLVGCTQSTAPPELASWSEQYAAARESVDLGSEFVLLDAVAYPANRVSDVSGEPVELAVTLVFESMNPTQDTAEGTPAYATQSVKYNDYHLAATLSSGDVALRPYPPAPAPLERRFMLQIGPQDALRLTSADGEAYMEKPVDRGNTEIHLVWDASKEHPDLKDVSVPVWRVVYYRGSDQLHIWVNAQTGTILTSDEEVH